MALLLEERIHCLVYIHCREMSVVFCFAWLPSHVILRCKMATPQQKSFCVIEFAKRNSVITVQRRFRLRYQIDPLNGWNIRRWYRQFVDRGCVCKGKSPGRIYVSEVSVALIQTDLALVSWPPWSPDLILWGFVNDVYLPPLPQTLEELKNRIHTAIRVTMDMLTRVWQNLSIGSHRRWWRTY